MLQPSAEPIEEFKAGQEDDHSLPSGQLVLTDGGFIWRATEVAKPRPEEDPVTRDRPAPNRSTKETRVQVLRVKRPVQARHPHPLKSREPSTERFSGEPAKNPAKEPPARESIEERGKNPGEVPVEKYTKVTSAGFGWKSQQVSRNWRESLKSGIVIGLLLGCLSMVLFHQVALPVTQPNGGTPASGQASRVSLAPGNSLQITVPSAKVFVAKLGPYHTRKAADQVVHQLTAVHESAELVQETSGYSVWVNASLQRNDALVKLSGSLSPTIDFLTWTAKSYPTNLVTTETAATSVNKWFAAVVSALRVETGAAAGEIAIKDAAQSVHNAVVLTPSDSVWTTGSMPSEFKMLQSDMNLALKGLQGKQQQAAVSHVVDAWAVLQSQRIQLSSTNS